MLGFRLRPRGPGLTSVTLGKMDRTFDRGLAFKQTESRCQRSVGPVFWDQPRFWDQFRTLRGVLRRGNGSARAMLGRPRSDYDRTTPPLTGRRVGHRQEGPESAFLTLFVAWMGNHTRSRLRRF